MPRPAPVTAADLHRVFDELGVEVRLRKDSSAVALLFGTEIAVPGPNDRKRVVPLHTLRRIARACGADSYSDLLSSLFDRDPVKAGRPAPVDPAAPPTWGKQDVRDASSALRSTLVRIESWLRHGTHSQDTYERLTGVLVSASAKLDGWPPAEGDWAAPSDKGYRPSVPDSVTTGVGRATGLTAAAVRRGETFADWEHEERS